MFLSIVHGRGETRIQRLEGKVKEDWGSMAHVCTLQFYVIRGHISSLFCE